MRLIDICEPLFQYICRLSRMSRTEVRPEINRVGGEIEDRLKQMRSQVENDPVLREQFNKIENSLVFFVDFMIINSELYFAHDWKPLAEKWYGNLAGDEDFFHLLNDTLAEEGELANERLVVFYTCMGLGFSGMYIGDAQELRRIMQQVSARIRDRLDFDDQLPICPHEPANVDRSQLLKPIGSRLLGLALTLLVLLIALFFAYGWLYIDLSKELDSSLNKVLNAKMPYADTTANTPDSTRGGE